MSPLKQRIKKYHKLAVVSIFLLYTVTLVVAESREHYVSTILLSAWVFLIGQALIRIFRFLGELSGIEQNLLTTDYIVKVAKRTFLDCNSVTFCLVFAAGVSTVGNFATLTVDVLQDVFSPKGLPFLVLYILSDVFNFNECATWRAHQLADMHPLDYGSGMAHSYFHGYLKIVLPSKGDNNPSLKDRIKIFMDENSLGHSEFPVTKLVILVPNSGYCYPLLNDDERLGQHQNDIEPCEALQDTLRNRAGTVQRVYRGAAYRIRVRPQGTGDEVKFLYVVAEGATPIQTFREAFSSDCYKADILKEHKDEVISMFFWTLKHLIKNDPECRELVEVLRYDDENVNLVCLLTDWLLRQK